MLDYIANKDTSHEYLAYYRRAYKNVPLWVAVNAMTFGQTSKNAHGAQGQREGQDC